MLYRLLRRIARIALRWYYRSVEIDGDERIPATGPVILAANHNNALVDALLVATATNREVRLTAKATLLDNLLTRVLVQAVGIVPLRRSADESSATSSMPDAKRNRNAFQAIVDTLATDGVVLIFPEGRSHSEPSLAPLKTGCARMALQATDEGVRGLSIVPVGITFEAKGRPRTRILLHIGEAIAVDEHAGMGEDVVETLTAQLDRGLRDVTLNFSSSDDASHVLALSHTLSRALQETHPLSNPDPSLINTIQLARRIDEIRRNLPRLEPAIAQRVLRFVDDLNLWRAEARRLDAPIRDIGMSLSVASGIWFAVREVLITVTLAPVALWGRINHWIPLHVALGVSRLTSRNPDDPAMRTLVSGLFLVLAMYGLSAFFIARGAGWPWALAYIGSLPLAGSVDFWVTDRLSFALERARGYVSLRRNPERAQWLLDERNRLRSEAARLGDLVP